LPDSGDEPKTFDAVKTVQLTAFGGATATYTLHYSPDAGGTDQVTLIGRPLIQNSCGCNDGKVNQTLYVPLLTSVTLPDGSSYAMTYDTGAGPNSFSGNITSLILPTLGRYDWTYQTYFFRESNPPPPPPGGFQNPGDTFRCSIGLLDEIKRDAAGVQLQQTHYDTLMNSGQTTLRNTVKVFGATQNTLLSCSVHYFGLFDTHGFPITGDSPAVADPDAPPGENLVNPDVSGGKTRFLSSKTYDGSGNLLTYSYLSYADDARVDSEKHFYRNPIDGSLTSSTTDSTDFDGFGHYRTVVTTGSGFPGTSNTRTVTTRWNEDDPDTGGTIAHTTISPWLINLYSSITATEGASTRKSLYFFNNGTGFLERSRTMSGTSPDAHDVITNLTPDALGNVQLEEHFGGDTATVPATPLADASLTGRSYAIRHEYTGGVLSKSSYIDPACTSSPQTNCPSILDAADQTIDTRTGLTASARDTSGLATSFGYDTAGRLTSVAPPGSAQTTYSYTNTTSAAPASVRAETAITGTTDGLKSIYTYDSFGRLVQEATVANDMTRYRSTTYDALGRKVSESTLGALVNPHLTTFSYDALDRVISVTQPDGTITSFDRTSEPAMTKQTVKVFTDAGDTDAVTTTQFDRQNRLYSVQEPNGTVTTHTYDVADHLTSVTMPGEGVIQHRFVNYDGRGFLLSEQHPELGINGDGTTTYSGYDARGHVHNKLTGTPGGTYDLRFTYDAAERLISISDSGASHPLKAFTFGDANGTGTPTDFRQGKLLTATRYNRTAAPLSGDIVTTETYKYVTPSGRPSERDTEVKSGSTTIQSFQQMFSYDTLGR
jgi:YD repeat-containing protein